MAGEIHLGQASRAGLSVKEAPHEPASACPRGRTLRLLVAPHAAAILAVLVGRSCGFAELRDQLGDPPAEALLDRLEELIEIGALGHTDAGYELTGRGRELARLAMRLAALLRRAPGGPIEIDGEEARGMVEAGQLAGS